MIPRVAVDRIDDHADLCIFFARAFGKTFTPSSPCSFSIPSAINTSGVVLLHSRQKSTRIGSTTVSIW
jgi:hypothetical protein